MLHKKFLMILTVMIISLFVSATVFAAKSPKITSKEMDFYIVGTENILKNPVYFIGNSDVPYFSLKDCGELYTLFMREIFYQDQNISFELKFSKKDEVGTLTRVDGEPYTMTVDCAADKITFLDYDAFIRPDEKRVLVDVLSADDPLSDDDVNFFKRTSNSYERYGDELVLDLAAYGIDLVADDKDCYIPAQTFSDFLLAMKYVNLYYNGKAIFFAIYTQMNDTPETESELGKIFYSVKPKKVSEEMGKFNYAELCLAFDNLYGLKEIHGIENFDSLCRQVGCREILMGTDTEQADEELYTIISKHLDDLHSNFNAVSPFSRKTLNEEFDKKIGMGQSKLALLKQRDNYLEVREKFYPNGVPAYEEIGNTAYITFDKFIGVPQDADYYQTAPTENATDTIGIILYAYSRIMRENSPIENVVLDLSCNTGGEADTAIYTVSAFLGEGYASLKNTMTNALATGVYNVDVNLDHKYDLNDRGFLSKKIFCLISPVSFSCGNLVPNVFKNSNKVTLIGRTSGGGSCVILPMTTAYGTYFQLSGPMRLAFIKNGSFYDIDRGAEPDYPLMFPESFYNRANLTKYINEIK